MDLTGMQPGHAGSAPDCRQDGPAAVRMLLGARLRKLRESARVTPEDAAAAIRASPTKICRLELGHHGFKSRDLTELLNLYGVSTDERPTLLAMARQANVPGWWRAYSNIVPKWFSQYLGLEQAAAVIRTYQVQFIPGLLQTRDYAEAVLRIGEGDRPGDQLGRLVNVRMRRQQILHRPRPVRLWALVDEGALRRPIGGAAVMYAQLNYLIELNRLSHIKIQVAPLSSGSLAVTSGPVTVLRFSEAALPDMVYLEQHAAAQYLDKPGDGLYYRKVLDRLATDAPPPNQTAAILRRIIDET